MLYLQVNPGCKVESQLMLLNSGQYCVFSASALIGADTSSHQLSAGHWVVVASQSM